MSDYLKRLRNDGLPVKLRRVGDILVALSLPFIIVGYQNAPSARAVYALMVTAGCLVTLGYLLTVGADLLDRRRFSWVRLVMVLFIAFCYQVSGPILMSAVAAAGTPPHLSGREHAGQ